MSTLMNWRRRTLAAVIHLTVTSTAFAQALGPCAPTGPLAPIDSPTFSAAGDRELPAFTTRLPAAASGSPAVAAWDIVLEIQDPRSLDLELEVYDRDPKSAMPSDPVCVANQPGSLKRCRVNADRLRGGEVWARATAVGSGNTDYKFSIRALSGPTIGDTGLFGTDARPADARRFEGIFEPTLYARTDSATFQQLYCVGFTSQSMFIQLAPTRGAGLFTLSAYGRDARNQVQLLSETSMATLKAFLFVPIPEGVKDGFVLVRLEGRPEDAVAYRVDLADRRDWRGTVADGYVYRTMLTDDQYRMLSTFGRCHEQGSTPDPATCQPLPPSAQIYRFFERFAWGITETPANAPITDPIIAFLGTDRLSTTVLVEPTEKGQYADPRQTILRSRGSLWTVYVEDDNVPFETFANVRFSQGDLVQEFILERPGSRESLRASATGRRVRIGVKRFQSDRSPVNVLVTFSREGQNYPRQAWSRTYRLRDRSRIAVTFGLTVVGNDVRANAHNVVLTQREFREPGAESEIIQVHYRRLLFGTALFSWPGIRARCAEQPGTFWLPCASWRAFVPNLSVGVGIPMEGPDTYVLGLNWPISGMDVVQLTAGVTATRQQKLRPGVRQDTLIPRNAAIRSFVYDEFTYTPLIGLTVDFGAVARRIR